MNWRGIMTTALLGLVTAGPGAAVAETPPPLCKAVFPTPLAAHDPDSTLAFHGAALKGADGEPLAARNIIERNWFGHACGDQPCEITGNPSHTVELEDFATSRARNRLRVRPFRDHTHTGPERDFRGIRISPLGELHLQPSDERWRIKHLRVSPGATLTLAPGDYWVEKLHLAPAATIKVDGPGTVRLFVKRDFNAAPRARLNPGPEGDFKAGDQLLLVGYDDIRLAPMARASGNLYADGDIHMSFGTRVHGDLAANQILLGFGARVDALDEAIREERNSGLFCLDEIPPPEIELDGEDPDSTQGSSYPLSGTITAGTRWYPVTNAEITGGALDEPRTLERDDQGAFSTSVPLVWGENRLRVTATDAKDNTAEAIRTVERVDPDPPELSLDNPAEAIISTETATVSGRAQDSHSGVAAISIRAGDGDPVSPAPDDEGHFTAELPLTVGEHEIRIQVTDRYGNETEQSIRIIRTTPPELTVNNPDSATVTENAVEVTGTATDDLGVAEVLVRNARYGSAFSATLNDDGTFTAQVPLQLDNNPLTVIARDIADNTTEHALAVERLSPPELKQLQPADGGVVHKEAFTLAGRISTDLPIDRLRLNVNGSRVLVGTDDTAGHPFQVPELPLRWGTNNFTVRVESPHGNDERELSLSRVPEDEDSVPAPEVELLTPADGERISESSVAVAGRVSSHAGRPEVRVNGRNLELSGGGTSGRFDTRVNFPEGEDTLTIQAVAVDALDRRNATEVTVHRDAGDPVIELDNALAPAPEDNAVRESPYRLTGTVTDTQLAGLLINDGPVNLEPTAEPGEYRFQRDLALTTGEQRLTLEAFDDAGNRTRKNYNLSLDPSALLEAVLPAPNSRFLVEDGQPPETQVLARLDGEAPGATAVALIGDQETSLSLEGGLVEGRTQLPVEAGDYRLRIEVNHPDEGLVAATQVPLTVRDPASEPLRLTRLTPDPEAGTIRPNRPLALHFNRPVELDQLDVKVLETLHGEAYRNPDPPGANFLEAEGYQLQTVHRDREPVPGELEIVARDRVLTFTPERFYGHGARLQVEVQHQGEELARRQFRVEDRPTQVAGSVIDQFGNAVTDLPVALGGLRTRTDEHGSFAFGFGDNAGQVPAGEATLTLNPDRQDPRYGSGRRPVSLTSGRFTELDTAMLPLINEATGFTGLRGGQSSRMAQGQLEIDLTDAALNGPDGAGRVSVNPQLLDFSRLSMDVRGPTPPFGVYVLQPEGVQVSGPVGLQIAAPEFQGERDWMEDSSPLVIMGLNKDRDALVPVGVGQVDGEYVVLDGKHWRGHWLDYLALALPPEQALSVLQAWLDGEAEFSAVRRALGG